MAKRFYKQVSCVEAEGGYGVQLDGRAIKTPAGSPLVIPHRKLAEAIAAEWDAQVEDITPQSMPLMQLSATALDRVPTVRDGLIEGVLRYADTDLLCYRAEHPDDLVRKQAAAWQPLLDWSAAELGATFAVAAGIVPVAQDPSVHPALRAHLTALDDWTLTAVAELVGISGSIVVGLAVHKGRLDADGALEVCHLDEDYQIERWGKDEEALTRRKNIAIDIHNATRFMQLLG
ncbi:ATP12 family chaperone protein [Magnetovibrio blakemorei]|uniref:ATPase n=1 Tax=Magnetovibrio blakemorei TaxID=28181 RepID=A0A1E5QA15_9PROT|nr:ATP12 family protein [Magnetovibrio blakemorei]OEJ68585.1 hypothetical protein BEN30_00105 [Magnetovibrio blakemorei]